jgi:hypothetical protein
MTTALDGGEGSASRPGRSLPPGKTRYSLYRRMGGPQGWSGQVRKISPPTGIRSPDRPARRQSLYRLSYPAHKIGRASTKINEDRKNFQSAVPIICTCPRTTPLIDCFSERPVHLQYQDLRKSCAQL